MVTHKELGVEPLPLRLPGGGLPGIPNWDEALGHTQGTLEKLYLKAGLGIAEVCLGVPLEAGSAMGKSGRRRGTRYIQ